MHLHDRHGAHLTLQTPLKQAGQSPAAGDMDELAEGFPYSRLAGVTPLGLAVKSVKIALHDVT